ncbi:hypothetical protein AB4455_25930 [Vibrio sp. 10N.261.46.E12]|uniref:hypothetical protein n=2 Tax=unclassified Vibrio TaxID=2614977 RepID=UPI0009762D28|nr:MULTISPECIES: hypothetical protein [unclassified Vibrio]PML94625.1 hypothetical protein BCT66_23805 [Vibrio sp. 10N.261.49.E11]PMN28040.1 hypothetical protein BCT34_19825 [Vibrio sp. 10N.261.45.E2]OMO36076.1 hypothetical protein BH584_05650 [Vibrio sp. 10N.261.45.E1]PMJ31421.1 hypothetical protein BCU27_25560 [Vibrio sp. 10N.286.45.B6]PMM76341.1 hypothetical protein BCT48_24895 [Vibrio sp. 10N.261.46.F12]
MNLKKTHRKIMTLIVLLFTSLSQASTIENDELLLKSLINRGVICTGLTYEENQEALRIYLNAKKAKSNPLDSKNRKEITNKQEVHSKKQTTNTRQLNKTPQECIRPNSGNRSE